MFKEKIELIKDDGTKKNLSQVINNLFPIENINDKNYKKKGK